MKKIIFFILISVFVNVIYFNNAMAGNKAKIVTLEVETQPIDVKADAPKPATDLTTATVNVEEPVNISDAQAKNFYDQKIKLMEKCLELKSQQIELLRESVAHRENTIDKLEHMLEKL